MKKLVLFIAPISLRYEQSKGADAKMVAALKEAVEKHVRKMPF